MEAINSKNPFYLGDWCVIPEQCRLQNSETSHHIQPKLMEVLLYFAEHPGGVLSTDELIEACWKGQPMTDNPIHKTIAQLRKALGDSSDAPKYIKTIPRKGYVLIAKLSENKSKSNSNQVEAYWREQAPFIGDRAFQPHHHSIFFGRQQAQQDFLHHIKNIDSQDSTLFYVSGDSGCGKSSFIQAGIIPQLLNPQLKFKLIFTQAIHWQLADLASINELLDVLFQHQFFDPSLSLNKIQQHWQDEPSNLTQFMAVKHESPQQRTVLFVDQIEQWFDHVTDTSTDQTRLNALFELIAKLSNSQQFFIIMASREEALPAIKALKSYRALSNAVINFRLSQLHISQYKDWIQATMQAAGLFFEVSSNSHESLLDLMTSSIEKHQHSLTTVQIMLAKLYEKRESSQLKYDSYKQMGGFKHLINHQTETLFKSLSNQQQQSIIEMFPQLINFESILNPEPKSKLIPWQLACDDLGKSLLTQLINLRLLNTQRKNDSVYVAFSEISLPYFWIRLVQWVASNKQHLLKQSEVQLLNARWLLRNKNVHYLMDKNDLSYLEETKRLGYFNTDDQQQFLTQSNRNAKQKHRKKRFLQLIGLVFLSGTTTSVMYGIDKNNTQQQTQQQLNQIINFTSKDLSPQLKAKGQLAMLENTQQALLKVIEASEKNNPNQPLTTPHAATLNMMGEISFNHRKNDLAIEYFTQSEEVIKNSGNNSNPELLSHLMLSQYWLGYLDFVDSDFKPADVHWQAYLNTSLRLRELEPENTEWQLEHSYALNNLGSLSEKTGEFRKASEYFAQSIEIKSSLLAASPDNMNLQADLADSLSWQGNIYRKQGSLQEALLAYQASARLTQSMKAAKGKGNTKLHREVLAIHRMASLLFDMGDMDEAHELADAALEKSLLLNELDRENNGYKAELLNLHLLNAQLYRHSKSFDDSLKHIQKADQIIDHFKLNLAMTPRIASYQMHLKREQAMIFKHFGQFDSAKTAIEAGLLTWADYELTQKQTAQVFFAMLHLNMAQILQQQKASFDPESTELTIKDHLDQAWQEIDYLLSQNSQDYQLMAISLAIAYTRTGGIDNQEYIQALIQSEYRNPEYYQPLIEAQLISLK